MVINAKPKAAVFLGYKQHRGAIRGIGRADELVLQHLLDLILCICELEWTEFVKRSVDGRSLVLQIDLEYMAHPYWWYTLWQF